MNLVVKTWIIVLEWDFWLEFSMYTCSKNLFASMKRSQVFLRQLNLLCFVAVMFLIKLERSKMACCRELAAKLLNIKLLKDRINACYYCMAINSGK